MPPLLEILTHIRQFAHSTADLHVHFSPALQRFYLVVVTRRSAKRATAGRFLRIWVRQVVVFVDQLRDVPNRFPDLPLLVLRLGLDRSPVLVGYHGLVAVFKFVFVHENWVLTARVCSIVFLVVGTVTHVASLGVLAARRAFFLWGVRVDSDIDLALPPHVSSLFPIVVPDFLFVHLSPRRPPFL